MASVQSYRDLIVWQKAMAFAAKCYKDTRSFPQAELYGMTSQIRRSAASIPANIAEGNGKYTGPDRCRYFDHARGSALECSAALDVLVAKDRYRGEELVPGKDRLWSIVSMLVGLIKANSDYRMHDQGQDYDYE